MGTDNEQKDNERIGAALQYLHHSQMSIAYPSICAVYTYTRCQRSGSMMAMVRFWYWLTLMQCMPVNDQWVTLNRGLIQRRWQKRQRRNSQPWRMEVKPDGRDGKRLQYRRVQQRLAPLQFHRSSSRVGRTLSRVMRAVMHRVTGRWLSHESQ